MARLVYLEEAHTELLTGLTGDLFAAALTFKLRAPDGYGLLSSALAVPHQPNYRTLPQKAAALQYHLSMNHPFLDGNKRFAVAAMETFIAVNRAALITTDQRLMESSLAVANHEISKSDLIRWVERRTVRLDWPEPSFQRWLARLSPSSDTDAFEALHQISSCEPPLSYRIYDALRRQS